MTWPLPFLVVLGLVLVTGVWAWIPRRQPLDFSPERRRLRALRALTATQRNPRKKGTMQP